MEGTDITNEFTDQNFMAAVRMEIGKCDGEPIFDSFVKDLLSLNVSNRGIISLNGIEHFAALKSLSCNGNLLTALDLSKNTVLVKLWCNDNQLTEMNVSKCTALAELVCNDNQLTALNVSGCTKLTTLICNDNQLTALDVSKNSKLIELRCQNNDMAEESYVTGFSGKWDDVDFIFQKQRKPAVK